MKQINKFPNDDNPNLILLSEALRELFQNNISEEEKDWIRKIESLRNELNLSKTEIVMQDFGVDKSESNFLDKSEKNVKIVTNTIGNICTTGSKSYFWALLLFKLIRKFRPTSCLELGSLLGISASYQAAALIINKKGKLTTLEGSESLSSVARNNFENLRLNNIELVIGRFQDTLQKVIKNLGTIDYAFIDGHHDENATIAYFNNLVPNLAERAILIFDDISWTEGMKRAWEKIISHNDIQIAIDLTQVGICIFQSKNNEKKNIVKIQML